MQKGQKTSRYMNLHQVFVYPGISKNIFILSGENKFVDVLSHKGFYNSYLNVTSHTQLFSVKKKEKQKISSIN